MRSNCWTNLTELEVASSILKSNLAIDEHEKRCEKKKDQDNVVYYLLTLFLILRVIGKSFGFILLDLFGLFCLICPIFTNRYFKWNFWLTYLVCLSINIFNNEKPDL